MKKRFLALFLALILCAALVSVTASAASSSIVDEAGALSSKGVLQLNNLAQEVTNAYGCEVSVVFVENTGAKGIMDFADDYFDYNGFGYGEDDSGIMLVVSVGTREYWITTHAYGVDVFTDKRIEGLKNEIVPYLGDSNWGAAAEAFIYKCATYLEEGVPQHKMSPMALPISLIAGFLISFLPMGSMKAQMKPVARQTQAANYVPEGGSRITDSRDIFLYHTQTRRKIEKSSSGSTTHTSSSGRSHGGGGGKF